jgi:hypothetical protein
LSASGTAIAACVVVQATYSAGVLLVPFGLLRKVRFAALSIVLFS